MTPDTMQWLVAVAWWSFAWSFVWSAAVFSVGYFFGRTLGG